MARTIEAEIPYPKPENLDPKVKPAFGRFPIVKERMRVEDLRGRESELSLEREGFVLVHWPTAVKNFRDPDEVRRIYVPEIEEMLKELTGAAKVTTDGPGLVRLSRRSTEQGVGVGTGNFVHADYSKNAGPTWINRALPEAEATERLKKRYGIYNVWRAYSPPPQDVPLGVCDARTVTQADVIHCDLTLGRPGAPGGFTFENSAYLYSPRHRWCYFSNMTKDEVLIFRGLESTHNWTSAVPHTAFEDPTSPPDAPARESIDIRSVVYYD